MGYRIRQIQPDSQFCDGITIETITEHVPVKTIEEVIEQCGARETRTRKLPALVVVLLCIGMNLFCQMSLHYVLVKLVQGVRLLHALGVEEVASKSSISEARYKLGAKPLEMLFKRICRPLATPDTPGAFAFGLRLVAPRYPYLQNPKDPVDHGTVIRAARSVLPPQSQSGRATLCRWLSFHPRVSRVLRPGTVAGHGGEESREPGISPGSSPLHDIPLPSTPQRPVTLLQAASPGATYYPLFFSMAVDQNEGRRHICLVGRRWSRRLPTGHLPGSS